AIAAVLLWVGYRRAHARMVASKRAAESVETQLRDLTTQYQAAVRAGGDPALLGQRERELSAAGFEVPSSLDAARAMLRRMPSEDAFDYQRARAAADDAMATLARLKAEAERAQADAGQTREALRALEAQGDVATLLGGLRAREVAQREVVEAAEADARDAVAANLSWPANSVHVQTAIAACQAEQRAVERGMAAAETATANDAREDASLLAQAEQALKTAEDAAAALRTPDPLEKLAQILAHLVRTEELAGEVGTRARLAAQDIGLAPNRAAVEAERGRLEERLHILEGQLISRPALDAELADAQTSYTNTLESADTALRAIVESAASLATAAIRPASPVGNQRADERQLASRLGEVRAALESALATLHEVDAQAQLEDSLHEKGTLTQRLQAIERQLAALAEDMSLILTACHLPMLSQHTPAALAAIWPLTGKVSAGDLDRVQSELAQARNRLFATREREQRLAEELHHPGTALEIEECRRRVRELEEERALCQRAMRMIQDARDRIAREVLPTTERNMQLLLPELTAHRYWDVRLTPPDGEEGQLSQLDYRIRVWDQTAGRYVAKNLFSGGTRDQCSLALRLAFALATLPQELGVAPGFIFLDEPLSAFDVQRAQALVDLLTTGIIAQQFAQVVVISHQHAFDRRAFQYHIRMEGGQVVESDLPGARERASQPVRVRVATAP
ncbi:MAG TPA: hypothetical protein VF040_17635, partial [Ktedonobacterales bacterium]